MRRAMQVYAMGLSIGTEHVDDIIDDLREAFEKI